MTSTQSDVRLPACILSGVEEDHVAALVIFNRWGVVKYTSELLLDCGRSVVNLLAFYSADVASTIEAPNGGSSVHGSMVLVKL